MKIIFICNGKYLPATKHFHIQRKFFTFNDQFLCAVENFHIQQQILYGQRTLKYGQRIL